MSRFWIFAADPTRYHWDTLFVKGKELWEGVRNAAAQRYLKHVHKGDRIVCYHSAPTRSVYALAVAASDPYPHPDEQQRKFLVVNLKAVERLPRPVPYKELRTNRVLRRMRFLAKPRQALAPLTEHEYNEILRLSGLPPLPFR